MGVWRHSSYAEVPLSFAERGATGSPIVADGAVSVSVKQLKPEALQDTMPPDEWVAKLKSLDRSAGRRIAEQRQLLEDDWERRYRDGEQVSDQERPRTLGQAAYDLMQAGDCREPAFSIEKHLGRRPAGGLNPEVAEVLQVDRVLLGSGRSAELVRCFEGDRELPCGTEDDIQGIATASMLPDLVSSDQALLVARCAALFAKDRGLLSTRAVRRSGHFL
mmetsp:Transcript_22077/g.58403  ORF Transcript_22077/g.58403 Transcript_22077/m.58403 type:complete len:219 (-) Transcript_22077:74-730(-)